MRGFGRRWRCRQGRRVLQKQRCRAVARQHGIGCRHTELPGRILNITEVEKQTQVGGTKRLGAFPQAVAAVVERVFPGQGLPPAARLAPRDLVEDMFKSVTARGHKRAVPPPPPRVQRGVHPAVTRREIQYVERAAPGDEGVAATRESDSGAPPVLP